MVNSIPNIIYVNEAYVVRLRAGLMMADTGCKKAVGGTDWHKELQDEMDSAGKSYCLYPIQEQFQFGPGEPIRAVRGWRYNVGINGNHETIEVAEVDADVPGLCGPDDMARWNMILNFSDGTIETYGRKRLIEPSQTSHPCISLFQYPETQYYDISSDEEAKKGKDSQDHQSYPAENKSKGVASPKYGYYEEESQTETEDDMQSLASSSSGSGPESSHAHSSDERFESSSEESEETSIYEAYPCDEEKYMTKKNRKMIK